MNGELFFFQIKLFDLTISSVTADASGVEAVGDAYSILRAFFRELHEVCRFLWRFCRKMMENEENLASFGKIKEI